MYSNNDHYQQPPTRPSVDIPLASDSVPRVNCRCPSALRPSPFRCSGSFADSPQTTRSDIYDFGRQQQTPLSTLERHSRCIQTSSHWSYSAREGVDSADPLRSFVLSIATSSESICDSKLIARGPFRTAAAARRHQVVELSIHIPSGHQISISAVGVFSQWLSM